MPVATWWWTPPWRARPRRSCRARWRCWWTRTRQRAATSTPIRATGYPTTWSGKRVRSSADAAGAHDRRSPGSHACRGADGGGVFRDAREQDVRAQGPQGRARGRSRKTPPPAGAPALRSSATERRIARKDRVSRGASARQRRPAQWTVRLIGVVIEVGGKPALHVAQRPPLAGGVVGDLVAAEAADDEVLAAGVREVEARDRRRGRHRETL